ncbi:MAG: hypothetical protein GYA60_06125, partial [Candidatus Methanofastidiosa archaeon]|nr:hypothetical protein [Candidatus Methanofastidiosa archaeon]
KNIPCIIFINKTDIGVSDSIRKELKGFPIIEGSAKMGFGVPELLRSLMNFA